MTKYKKFFIPLFFSIVIILSFHVYQKNKYVPVIQEQRSENFYVVSDIHFLSDSLKDNSPYFNNFVLNGDGKNLLYTTPIVDSLIYDIKLNKPDFLVISGDLTLNGELASHFDLAKKLKEIEDVGTSVYVIPGNHDVNNPWARGFNENTQYKTETVSANDFKDIYKEFGYKEAISKDKNSLSYLVAPSDDFYLLMLDTNIYSKNLSFGIPEMSGEISKETIAWIKKCSKLAHNKSKKIIAISHHNLMNHSQFIYDGYTLDNNEALLQVFKDANITLNFSGHIHMQSIKSQTYDNQLIYDVSSSSLSTYPHKLGIATYTNDAISFETKTLDVEALAKFTRSQDETLLNFSIYSRDFYKNFIINQNLKWLKKSDKFTEDEMKDICETIANIRIKYDYKLDNITWNDITSSTGFQLLKSCNSIYIDHYIKIATDGNETENNSSLFKL